jgi:biotin carboxylase
LDFNVYGLKPSDMDYVKMKSKMKEKYVEAGLRVAKGKRITTQQDAVEFCSQVGFPIVVKPDIGVGAVSTFKICNTEELDATVMKDGYFVEEYIEGKIVTYDGFADAQGKVIFSQSHEYSHGVMDVINNNSHVYYYSYREIPADLQEAGEKTVKIFNIRERFFHIEFFRCPDDSLVCLEINFRPPGGFTMDMFNFAINVDMYKVYAEYVAGLRADLSYNREYHVCYISRKNHLRYKHSHEDILKSFTESIASHTVIPVGLQMMGDYGYIYRSKTVDELKKFTRYVWEKPDLNETTSCEWSVSPGPKKARSLSGIKTPLD